MNQQIQDDLKLFKKAKHRINAMLVFSYLLLGLWSAAIYFLLSQPLFERPHSFLIYYLTSTLTQMILWMLIFFALSEGKPKLRLLLILGIFGQIGWCGYLIYDMLQNPGFWLLYVIWIAMELVPVCYLLWLRGWLKNSWWARIFFDHVVELEGEEEQILQPHPQAVPIQQNPQGYAPGQPQGMVYLNEYYQNGYPQGQTNPGYVQPQSQPSQPWPQNPYQGQVSNGAMPGYGYPSGPIEQNAYPSQEDDIESTYVTPASSFAGHPDITQEEVDTFDDQEYKEQPTGKRFPFFFKKSQPHEEAQFINQNEPVDFQTDAQVEAQRQYQAARQNAYEVSQSYSQMALRMAVVVYGELILFPILINIFQNHFVSINNSAVFAINLMFTLCILSAVVWTIPIFFLYLKQPGVKKILWGAALCQVGVAAFGLWMLHGYYVSDTVQYSDKVFTYFLMAEVIRYGLLIAGILPAFQLPALQVDYPEFEEGDDDSDIVLELVAEEDPESEEDEFESIQEISNQQEQPQPYQEQEVVQPTQKASAASFLDIDDVANDPSSNDPTS